MRGDALVGEQLVPERGPRDDRGDRSEQDLDPNPGSEAGVERERGRQPKDPEGVQIGARRSSDQIDELTEREGDEDQPEDAVHRLPGAQAARLGLGEDPAVEVDGRNRHDQEHREGRPLLRIGREERALPDVDHRRGEPEQQAADLAQRIACVIRCESLVHRPPLFMQGCSEWNEEQPVSCAWT
jgi:hypothetical protein